MASTRPNPWWTYAGFAEAPRRVLATGNEILHRILNRSASDERKVPGSFFTFVHYDHASEAERALNIVEYENSLRLSGRFAVRQGTVMWVGPVAHGEDDVCQRGATQVYIERPIGAVEMIAVTPLKPDVYVSVDPATGRPRAGTA